MPKVRKTDLSFLYVTHCLVLFYISAKYHRNSPPGIRVTEQTRNLFQTKQREITPKVRKPEFSFLYATHHLVLFYISIKYHKQEAHGPQFAHLSDIATADKQMLCNIFPILSSQLMKISSFEQFLVLKNIWA